VTISLVTGGAGFIGSHLVDALLDAGDEVRVLDDMSSGLPANLEGKRVGLVQEDIRNASVVSDSVAGVDRLFHLAAMVAVPRSFEDPAACYDINLLGSIVLLQAARQAGIPSMVVASSCAVYGEVESPASEGRIPRPLSPYAASKLAMEQACGIFQDISSRPVHCLRFFNVYGPRQRPDSPYAPVIPQFILAGLRGQPITIFGDGQQSRDFIYVSDVVRAMILASETPMTIDGPINIGTGQAVTISRLVQTLHPLLPEMLSEIYGPARPGDIRHSQAAIDKAERALGFRSETDLQKGLQLTVQWFRAQLRRPTR
jgi:nucleoside-diphosphate-sugar epimerase